ncbi:MAG: TIGR00303 family protein [Coleofasciculaceae cyanobacterium]
MIQVYTEIAQGQRWLQKYQGQSPILACILGFTETGLIPGISAAGATPKDREYTAIADAEFLVNGVTPKPKYKLPPLTAGASPVFISRAVVEAFNLPVYLFNAGLPHPPAVSVIDLGGMPANCLTTGNALPLTTVKHLFEQGLIWGEKLATANGYVIISECVVGGTTTALSVLTGLGIAATGKVNSSHPSCNHAQKWQVVQQGLQKIEENIKPLELVAAVGDPMQVVAAGMAISASRRSGVLLAGGTQMLAVYALAQALVKQHNLEWQPTEIVVGTTRWVAEDMTGDTVGLAEEIGSVTLLSSLLSFATSRYPQLQAYEQGYVKEGVGAGGCAIAAHLYQNWNQIQLLEAIEVLIARYCLS